MASINDEISKLLIQNDGEVTEEKEKFEICKEIAATKKLIAEMNTRITECEQNYLELKNERYKVKLEHDLLIKMVNVKRYEMMSTIDVYEKELAQSVCETRNFIKALQDFISKNSGKVEALEDMKIMQERLVTPMKTDNLTSFAEKGKEDAIIDFNLATLDIDN